MVLRFLRTVNHLCRRVARTDKPALLYIHLPGSLHHPNRGSKATVTYTTINDHLRRSLHRRSGTWYLPHQLGLWEAHHLRTHWIALQPRRERRLHIPNKIHSSTPSTGSAHNHRTRPTPTTAFRLRRKTEHQCPLRKPATLVLSPFRSQTVGSRHRHKSTATAFLRSSTPLLRRERYPLHQAPCPSHHYRQPHPAIRPPNIVRRNQALTTAWPVHLYSRL